MLLGLTYQLIRYLTDLVLVHTRSDALLRWHRALVRGKWAAFRQRRPRQRPARDPER